MSKFAIATLGCKVNAYESKSYSESLIRAGFEEVDFKEEADLYIINTCAVTNTAAQKSRQKVNQAKRNNPNALICVVGCYVQIESEALSKNEGIDILIGASHKKDLVDVVIKAMQTKEKVILVEDVRTKAEFEELPISHFEHKTRAFLKVQDGCNQFCTYCTIPNARGRERSMNIDHAIATSRDFVASGHQEIVLSGIHTGRYGRDLNTDLTTLIQRMSNEIEDLKRIRISSIEIVEVPDKLLNEVATDKKVARHLHIPVQSGQNDTLKRMHRPYTTEEFLKRIAEIRALVPGISISTDLIVGFPGETEEEFNSTVEFIKQAKFSFIHVFPFSAKRNTPAYTMPDQVDERIKKQRVGIITELSKELYNEYMNQYVGKQLDVLIETVNSDGYSIGHSSEYIPVVIKNRPIKSNTMIRCVGVEVKDEQLYASEVL